MSKQADNLVANLGGTTGRANVQDHLWKVNLKLRSLVRVRVNVKVITLPSHTWSILIVLMIMDSRTQSYYKPMVTDYSLITRSLDLSDKPDRIGSNAENEKPCWTINMLIHHCLSSFKWLHSLHVMMVAPLTILELNPFIHPFMFFCSFVAFSTCSTSDNWGHPQSWVNLR